MDELPFCRVTVLAPRRSIDLSLPSDVPVADLVPMVLELVGEPDRTVARQPQPWRFSGAAGGPLPSAATLGELGVLDGELLRLGPLTRPVPPPVFDDPVDALASTADTATGARGGRRLGSAAALLVTAVAAGLLACDASPLAAVVGALGACGAVGYAAWLVRQVGPEPEAAFALARTVSLGGVVLAAAAGWAALPGPGAVLLASAAAGVTAAVAQVAVRVVAPSLVATGVMTTAVAAADIAVRFGASPVAAAAGTGALAIVAGPLLPRVALRMSGLPRPLVPADGGELVDADEGSDVLPPEELAERADLARGFLAGLAGGAAAVAAAAAIVAGQTGGWAGAAFGGVTVAVLALRTRGYADRDPARASTAAAIGAGVALAVFAGGAGGPMRPLAAAGLMVAAAAATRVLAAPAADRPWAGSPVTRRTVDLLEGVLVAASVPLALAAMGLFQIVRGL